MADEPKYPVKTVTKAIEIINYLAQDTGNRGIGVSELSRVLGMGKSTVHRLLDTLSFYGYVEQDGETNQYRLGWELYKIGQVVPQQNQLLNLNPGHDFGDGRGGDLGAFWRTGDPDTLYAQHHHQPPAADAGGGPGAGERLCGGCGGVLHRPVLHCHADSGLYRTNCRRSQRQHTVRPDGRGQKKADFRSSEQMLAGYLQESGLPGEMSGAILPILNKDLILFRIRSLLALGGIFRPSTVEGHEICTSNML